MMLPSFSIVMNLKSNLIIGVLFILAGALLNSDTIIRYFKSVSASSSYHASAKVAQATAAAAKDVISGQPSHITLPRLNISVDIEPGYFNASTQSWTLSDTKAQFATMTSQPNTASGNTYIYGHNRSAVFSSLHKAVPGDEAIVTTTNGHAFTYKLVSSKDVLPTDVSLFDYKGKPILTLQTCSGIWDQYRGLFVFDLEGVK